MIKLPRLLDKNLKEIAVLHPTRVSATDKLDPTSTATMGLPKSEPEVVVRDFVELYDDKGTKGIYRVEGLTVSNSERQTVNLSHGIVTLEDTTLPDDITLSGTIKNMIKAVLDKQEKKWWQLGTVEAPENETYTVSAAGSLALQALVDIAALAPEYFYGYDQSTTPWTLHFMRREDTPSCECRLSRNISSASITISVTDMCTRVTSDLLENGYMDADTVEKWGIISRELDTEDDTTAEGAIELAEAYLAQYKNPSVSIEIDAFDLANRTHEPLDELVLGKLCRVALPDWGFAQNHQIISVYYADLLKKPEQKKITLSTRAARAETALAQAAKAASQSSKNYKHIIETANSVLIQAEKIALLGEEINLKATKAEVENATMRVSTVEIALSAAEAKIDLKADRTEYNELEKRVSSAEIAVDGANAAIALKADLSVTDDLGTRLSTAEINLSAADQNITLLTGRVDDQGNLIDGVVLDLDGQAGRITALGEEILLKADKIDLVGLVTATELEAGYAKIADLSSVAAQITNLTSGLTTATIINAGTLNGSQVNGTYGSFDALTHNGALVSQRAITMGSLSSVGKALSTGGALDLQHSHKVTVNDDGTVTLGEVSAEGGNFKIADTKVYKDGVSAAYGSGYNEGFAVGKENYNPTAINRTGYSTTDRTVTVRALNAHQDLLTGQVIDASEIYDAGYTSGQTAGKNAVTLSKKWSGGVLTVTASNGKTSTAQLSKGTESWNGNEVSVPVLDGSGSTGYTIKVNVQARYDAGYAAGWAAAKSKIALDGYNINGPAETVDTQERLYQITAGATLNNIQNTAANYFYVGGYAYAYVNGSMVNSQFINKANTINVGQ